MTVLERAELDQAARLAELELLDAARAADLLVRAEVLAEAPLCFAHPLVRGAVYRDMTVAEWVAAHGRAARLLDEAHASPGRVGSPSICWPPLRQATTGRSNSCAPPLGRQRRGARRSQRLSTCVGPWPSRHHKRRGQACSWSLVWSSSALASRIGTINSKQPATFPSGEGSDLAGVVLEVGIIDATAASRYGTKTDGSAEAASREVLAKLAGLIAEGHLEIPIAKTYPLTHVREAFWDLEKRHTLGKIVLGP